MGNIKESKYYKNGVKKETREKEFQKLNTIEKSYNFLNEINQVSEDDTNNFKNIFCISKLEIVKQIFKQNSTEDEFLELEDKIEDIQTAIDNLIVILQKDALKLYKKLNK